MPSRINNFWLLLFFLTGILSLLYLWYTLFPGKIAPETFQFFSPEQVKQGREYNQIPRLMFILSFILQTLYLGWFVLSGRMFYLSKMAQKSTGGSFWGSIFLFFLVLWLILRLINLPFLFYNSYIWQHAWGFSTQTFILWWIDYFKGAGLDFIMSFAGIVVLFWIMVRWPVNWWLVGAGALSVWLIVQTFLWPVVFAPIFNKFVPEKDPAVLAMVHELSSKSEVPVNQVLVMDASQRTTKANAYFAGLGTTKQLVLYDNLLTKFPADEVKAVLAHEMAHWRQGHIVKGLALGILGTIIGWGLLALLLKNGYSTIKPQPYTWAVIILFLTMFTFVSSPIQNYFSRTMEREADQVSVHLTRDVSAAISLQTDLAIKNLSDVAPPTFIRWFDYSHPTAVERIKLFQIERSKL